MSQRQLGPIVGATLLHHDIDHVVSAYQRVLGFSVTSRDVITKQHTACWQAPALLGNKRVTMQAANGDSWLRIIEDSSAKTAIPLKSYGWMALETNVADVDNIRQNFTDSSFEIIGEPAYLQVSDAIKAMQVIGPAGEVSYLTQVERAVPPFELPMTTSDTGSLFIPVLCTPSRADSLAFYQQLNNADKGLNFDTKITVLNKAWGHNIEHQYPVATLQLAGNCLFEIDQVDGASHLNNNIGSLPSGIAMITCQTQNIHGIAEKFGVTAHKLNDPYYPTIYQLVLTGPAGERIELTGN